MAHPPVPSPPPGSASWPLRALPLALLAWAALACAPTQARPDTSIAPGGPPKPIQDELAAAPAEPVAAPADVAAPAAEAPAPAAGPIVEGQASWYGPNFRGRRTANGEVFDPAQLTAAHRTLPFGTRVRVTHAENGRSVVVRINDRGPFKKSRVIDLSEAAAREIGLVRSGVAWVRVEHAGQAAGQRQVAQDPRLSGYDVLVPGVPAGTLLVLRGSAQVQVVVRVVEAAPPSGEGLDGDELFAAPSLVERLGPVVELVGL